MRNNLLRPLDIDKLADRLPAPPPTSTIMGSGMIGSPSTMPIPVLESISIASKKMSFLKSKNTMVQFFPPSIVLRITAESPALMITASFSFLAQMSR